MCVPERLRHQKEVKIQPNSSFKTFEIKQIQELLGCTPCWGFAEGQTRLLRYPIWS